MCKIKIYLDDLREAPIGWVRTKTAKETINILELNKNIDILSLDHDLGDEKIDNCGTGYDVLLWIENKVATTNYKPPRVIKTHSANVSARQKMDLAIIAIDNIYRSKNEPKIAEIVPVQWIHVDDGLPIIPLTQFAISVLIIMYDYQYAEACKCLGWEVYHASYGATTDREGVKSKYFKHSDKEFDFMCLEHLGEGTDWCPTVSPVVYWAYYPNIPSNPKLSKEVKRYIAFDKFREEHEEELKDKTFFEMQEAFNNYNKICK